MIQISYNEFKQIKRRWIMAESHTRKYCPEKVFLFLFEKKHPYERHRDMCFYLKLNIFE